MREFMRKMGWTPRPRSAPRKVALYAYWWCPRCGAEARTQIVNRGGYWEKIRPSCHRCGYPMQEIRPCGQC